jgi:hypothetical protein
MASILILALEQKEGSRRTSAILSVPFIKTQNYHSFSSVRAFEYYKKDAINQLMLLTDQTFCIFFAPDVIQLILVFQNVQL